jgi:gamma-glutamyltranspeptidase
LRHTRLLLLVLLMPLLGTMPRPPEGRTAGVRSPAFAADGRLVVSIAGDLWVLLPDGRGGWDRGTRVTHGPAWDRDPAWLPGGDGIVFASDRSGTIDLWRVVLADGRAREPVRLTRAAEHDVEPSVSPTGDIVFARGSGGDTDLWLLATDGSERPLTREPGGEREPAWSPDGASIAYVALRLGRRELRVLRDSISSTLVADRQVRAPAWSPDGSRIVFSAGGRDAGLWIVRADGSYPQPASSVEGVAAWSPDGRWLVIAEADAGDGGYNGDPDRLGERLAGDPFRLEGGLRSVEVPAPVVAAADVALDRALGVPDAYPAGEADAPAQPGRHRAGAAPAGVVAAPPAPPSARARNAAAYDRVWSRVARLYYGMPVGPAAPADVRAAPGTPLAEWSAVGLRHRPAAEAAADGTALEDAIWAAVRARPRRPVARGQAGVSSAHPLATAAGLEILELGGNVVDAAVAVSFALGVVEPDASGIGGYGQMLIQLPALAEPTSIEFLTRVPEAATLGNSAVDAIPRSGPGVANVPGTVAGMELAWRRHGSGRVAWSRLLEPAIRLAEQGIVIDDALATTLRRERERFAEHESSRALFFRNALPLAAGDTLRNPDLAWTLRQIAADGADAFYRGAVAERMVEDLVAGGNLMTAADLRRYYAAERAPLRTTYRGHTVYSGPPPVTGGAVLLGKLNLLERTAPGGLMTEDAATLHAMIEAWKLQPTTSGRVADPDLWPVDVTPFESKDTAAVRWRCYDRDRASPANALTLENCGRSESGDTVVSAGAHGSGYTRADAAERGDAHADGRAGEPGAGYTYAVTGDAEECLAHDRECRGTGTTAFVVADADGGIVSVTQTLGTWGGNFYVTPGLGFLYNDKLRSYGSNPDGYNARLPYARNTTIITPTIVFRGSGPDRQPWFGVGAAGNAWIAAAVYTAVVGMVDHGLGAQDALELPRFLAGGRGIQIEDSFSPAALRTLESMGHVLERISLMGELRMGYGAAVMLRDGQVEAAGDPRRSGVGGATGGGRQ